jgi:hypothetical protein
MCIDSWFVILRLYRSRKLSGQKALKTLDSRSPTENFGDRLRENDEFLSDMNFIEIIKQSAETRDQ